MSEPKQNQNHLDQPQKPASLLKMSIMGLMAFSIALVLITVIYSPIAFLLESNIGIVTFIIVFGLLAVPISIVYYAVTAWKSNHKLWIFFIICVAPIAMPLYWFKYILNIDWYKRPQTEFTEP